MNAVETQLEPKTWRPHKIQEEFLRIPSTIFEAFYGGAAGGGKSDILLMLPIVKEWYKIPQFNGALFRRTFPELEESLIFKSDTGIGYKGPTYRDFEGKYDRSKHVWTFPSGAKLRFLYSMRESDVHQHDTAEFHYLGLDELTHFTWYQYSYLMHRCRSTIPGIPAVVRAASNPGNIGHTWVRKRFIDPCKTGRKILTSKIKNKDGEERQIKRIFIPAKASDNPYLAKADPDYVLRLGLLTEADRKAKAEGDWSSFSGQVFSEFREKHHEGEPDNAVHVIPADSVKIEKWWPKFLILDWGFEAMTYAMWLAMSPWRRVYLYREYHCYRKSIQTWGADLRRISQQDSNIVAYVVDKSANKQLGMEKTVWAQIIDATGMPFELSDSDRLGGIGAVHDLLRWKPRPARFTPKDGFNEETRDRIFRQYGTEAAKTYESLFIPDVPETDLPLIHIFDSCPIIIQTIPMVVYAENKISGKKAEDYQEFDGDDPIDTLRYAAKRVEAFMESTTKEFEKYKKIDAAISEFKRTGNYNDLDRTLSLAEREEVGTNRPVPRGSARGHLLNKVGGRTRPRKRSVFAFH